MLISASEACDIGANVDRARRKRHRQLEDDVKRRAAQALTLVQIGELSSGHQALEGVDVALGTERTLNMLRDPRRGITKFFPELPFNKKFLTNLRSSRRGDAGGPSSMTSEHLKPVLDTLQDAQLLFKMGEQLSRAQAPSSIASAIRFGTITAFQKPNGGVRGIFVGDTLRQLVARTIAQQLSVAVEAAIAPFQFALSAQAGTECVAHAMQSLTEENPTTTVMSIDGIGAFDLVSRKQ